MRIRLEVFLVLFLCASPCLAEANQWLVDPLESRVGFVIHSTLHEVNGQAQKISGSLLEDQNIAKGFIKVDVAGLSTGNLRRDKNMYQMFDLGHIPDIRMDFDQTDLSHILKHPYGEVLFKGSMSIHDVTRPVSLLIHAYWQGGQLVCEGHTIVHLKDYELKPPNVLGLIHVKDDVDVAYKIVFINKG